MRSRQRRVRDVGSTYVEVVVAIVLIGLVVVPTLAAVRTSIRTSTTAKAAAEVETELINLADAVEQAPHDSNCDYTNAVVLATPTGWTVTVEHSYLKDAVPDPVWSPFTGGCPSDAPYTGRPIVKVSITITHPDSVVRTLEVVKDADL
jgi:type II secretory pathway pseudopilin PulG